MELYIKRLSEGAGSPDLHNSPSIHDVANAHRLCKPNVNSYALSTTHPPPERKTSGYDGVDFDRKSFIIKESG